MRNVTVEDVFLKSVMEVIVQGWLVGKKSFSAEVESYFKFRDELMIEDELIFLGQPLVIQQGINKLASSL